MMKLSKNVILSIRFMTSEVVQGIKNISGWEISNKLLKNLRFYLIKDWAFC